MVVTTESFSMFSTWSLHSSAVIAGPAGTVALERVLVSGWNSKSGWDKGLIMKNRRIGRYSYLKPLMSVYSCPIEPPFAMISSLAFWISLSVALGLKVICVGGVG